MRRRSRVGIVWPAKAGRSDPTRGREIRKPEAADAPVALVRADPGASAWVGLAVSSQHAKTILMGRYRASVDPRLEHISIGATDAARTY
jgi:hypothetical protein